MRTLPLILAVLLAIGLWAGAPAWAGSHAAAGADRSGPAGATSRHTTAAAPAFGGKPTDGPRPVGEALTCASRPADALAARGSPRVDSFGPALPTAGTGAVNGPAGGRISGPPSHDGPSHGRAPLWFPLLN